MEFTSQFVTNVWIVIMMAFLMGSFCWRNKKYDMKTAYLGIAKDAWCLVGYIVLAGIFAFFTSIVVLGLLALYENYSQQPIALSNDDVNGIENWIRFVYIFAWSSKYFWYQLWDLLRPTQAQEKVPETPVETVA